MDLWPIDVDAWRHRKNDQLSSREALLETASLILMAMNAVCTDVSVECRVWFLLIMGEWNLDFAPRTDLTGDEYRLLLYCSDGTTRIDALPCFGQSRKSMTGPVAR